jgi:hypothetical protein
MISTLRLKFGRGLGIPAVPIQATPVTVFVGPNNSGKSKILREVEHFCQTGESNSSNLLLDELAFTAFPGDKALDFINTLKQISDPRESARDNHIIFSSGGVRNEVPLEAVIQCLQRPNSNLRSFCSWLIAGKTSMLDGQSRISLVNEQNGGDLQQAPVSSLQVLFRDYFKRREVRRIIYEAFGSHFVIDPTNLGTLRIRLSEVEPNSDLEERALCTEAVQFYAAAQPIEETSDGVKAFTGIVTQLIAGDPRVLLIDEPEAFLHPALASKLGYEVSRAALSTDKRVFASTHSPMFVMGCIQSGAPVNIIRLTYRAGVATARLLPSNEISELMRNPLLRSTNVLNGLFYEFIIVTESDADRAFYQEVNERLLRFKPEWGIPNCLFINAQNKQTVHTIVRPLRQLGIPSAGIVDIDALKEGGTNWTNLLDGASIPPIAHNSFATLRSAVKQAMDRTGKDMKRAGGVDILDPTDHEAALDLLNHLADYGIFIVPGGELESWVKHLGVSRHGPPWLISVFEKMGEDPNAPGYQRPSDGDVWLFMSRIRDWLTNVNRKGIPV